MIKIYFQIAYALSAKQKNYVRILLAASFGYYTNYLGFRDVKQKIMEFDNYLIDKYDKDFRFAEFK